MSMLPRTTLSSSGQNSRKLTCHNSYTLAFTRGLTPETRERVAFSPHQRATPTEVLNIALSALY